jgi:hypothetical protein
MKNSLKKMFMIAGLATITLVGCNKKETTQVDNETQSAVDNAVADQEFASVIPTTNNHAIGTKGTGAKDGRFMATCDTLLILNKTAAYTHTPSGITYPQFDTTLVAGKFKFAPVFELNLATSCPQSFVDGKPRSGKWFIIITGPLRVPNNQMIVKLDGHTTNNAISYKCDNITLTTLASSTVFPKYQKFSVSMTGGECKTNNWTIKYQFNRTFTNYYEGKTAGSIIPVTEVFGTSEGVNREGKKFTVNIPQGSSCVKHQACQFIDKGVIELTPEGFKTRTIDFGNGTCDEDATFTVNGNTVAFKLK